MAVSGNDVRDLVVSDPAWIGWAEQTLIRSYALGWDVDSALCQNSASSTVSGTPPIGWG
jgi:hypothetical protein